jgi:acyl-coenzyme A thioesterase PaaI-like protein
MLQENSVSETESQFQDDASSCCFVCAPDHSRGLHLHFELDDDGKMIADWVPDSDLVGYPEVVHGGIVSTVLDEAMAKVVSATGIKGVTAELRVRYRLPVNPGKLLRIQGWIDSASRRMIKTEASLTTSDGIELAHAWAIFLESKS